MVVALQTLLEKSTARMGTGMNPIVKESALEVIRRAYAEGIYVQLSAGFRSFEEQNKLYAQGRTTKGSIVTNARGGQSMHNFGLAVDYFLLSPDGRTAIWTVNAQWRRVSAIAKELGFEWGGDWTSFPDPPHIQMVGGLTLKQLQAGQRPNLVSKVSSASADKEPEPPKTPEVPKEELSMRMLDLVGETKLNELGKIYQEARVRGILSSTDWEIKCWNKSLTLGEAIYLVTVLDHRRHFDKKGIN